MPKYCENGHSNRNDANYCTVCNFDFRRSGKEFGSGRNIGGRCVRCGGKGEIKDSNDLFGLTWIECPACEGKGVQ